MRRLPLGPAAVVVALASLAAGCGSTATTLGVGRPAPALVDDATSASALGRTLVAGVPLPPGATPVGSPPAPALASAPVTEVTPDIVDVSRLATTPLSEAATLAFLQAHPGAGTVPVGIGGVTGPASAVGTAYRIAFSTAVGAAPDITFSVGTCGFVGVAARRGATTHGDDDALDAAHRRVLGLPPA